MGKRKFTKREWGTCVYASSLHCLRKQEIGCYIQYTLNDYEQEGLEQGVPKLDERIDTFKRLVDKLGKGRVIWRFDPLMLTDDITIDTLLAKIENIGNQLLGYTLAQSAAQTDFPNGMCML